MAETEFARCTAELEGKLKDLHGTLRQLHVDLKSLREARGRRREKLISMLEDMKRRVKPADGGDLPGGEGQKRLRGEPAPAGQPVPEGGNFRLPVPEETLARAQKILDDIVAGATVKAALDKAGEWREPPPRPARAGGGGKAKSLAVIYSDFEVDDIFSIVQTLEWRALRAEPEPDPVTIFCVDFASKEVGQIFEKKRLMASLFLGCATELDVLTSEGDPGDRKDENGVIHPKQKEIVDARSGTIDRICDRLANSEAERIDLYVLAPGRGNLGALVQRLKDTQRWPLKARWKVSIYSGSYNIRGMKGEDIAALQEISSPPLSDHPMVDMSRFPFFGGKDAPEVAASFGSFVKLSFAERFLAVDPLLAAVVKLFNNEFNEGLIVPSNKNLFKGSTLDDAERTRLEDLKGLFARSGVEEYARALRADEGLWSKVASYKQSTVKAFAHGACDGPLCDQLVFLCGWILQENPSLLKERVVGRWKADLSTGYTSVDGDDKSGMQAMMPVLARPTDEFVLQQLRGATEDFIFRRLDAIRRP